MASHMAAEVYKLFINPLNQMSQSEKRIMFFFLLEDDWNAKQH